MTRSNISPCVAVLAWTLCACCGLAEAQTKPAAGTAPPASQTPAIDTVKRMRDSGSILIGVREASIPFSYIDASKRPQGYSVDLCIRIAEALKAQLKLPRLDVTYVPVTSANRISALLDGKIDLECGSTTNTRERQQQVSFAYTTFVAGIKMLAKKGSNINNTEDLRGKTIVVTKGTTSEKLMAVKNDEQSLKLKIIVANDHDESFRLVDEGKAVAFPMDDVLLYGLISKAKNPDEFAVVGKYLSVEPYGIVMRKGEPQFERMVDKALSDIFASGEVERLYDKWFSTRDLTVPMNQFLKEAFVTPNTYPAWP